MHEITKNFYKELQRSRKIALE